jgi:hypothetical protein
MLPPPPPVVPMEISRDASGVVDLTNAASVWSMLVVPPAPRAENDVDLWEFPEPRSRIMFLKMTMSLRIGSSGAVIGLRVKLVPVPVGAQPGCEPLA